MKISIRQLLKEIEENPRLTCHHSWENTLTFIEMLEPKTFKEYPIVCIYCGALMNDKGIKFTDIE